MVFPSSLNITEPDDNPDVVPGEAGELTADDVSYWWALSHWDAFLCYFSCFIGYASSSYNDSTWSLELYNNYGVSDSDMGLYGTLSYVGGIPGTLLTPLIFTTTPYRLQIVVSLGLIALSCIPKGPSLIFHLPQKLWLVVTGLTLQGVVGAPIFVTFLADIFLTFKARYRIVEGRNPKLDLKLANLLSSLGTVFYMSSPILVRSIGTWIYNTYGYQT